MDEAQSWTWQQLFFKSRSPTHEAFSYMMRMDLFSVLPAVYLLKLFVIYRWNKAVEYLPRQPLTLSCPSEFPQPSVTKCYDIFAACDLFIWWTLTIPLTAFDLTCYQLSLLKPKSLLLSLQACDSDLNTDLILQPSHDI